MDERRLEPGQRLDLCEEPLRLRPLVDVEQGRDEPLELLRELGIDWLRADGRRLKTIGKPILSPLRSVIS